MDVSVVGLLLVMLITLTVSLVPFVPGPALQWTIVVVFAALTDFERVTWVALIPITGLMLLGSTSEFWLRYFGMARRGGSCWGFLGSWIGGLLGTFFIPIPILGTLIGAVVGALVVELLRVREVQQAWQAGQSVLEMYIVNIVIEFSLSLGIFAVTVASVMLTA